MRKQCRPRALIRVRARDAAPLSWGRLTPRPRPALPGREEAPGGAGWGRCLCLGTVTRGARVRGSCLWVSAKALAGRDPSSPGGGASAGADVTAPSMTGSGFRVPKGGHSGACLRGRLTGARPRALVPREMRKGVKGISAAPVPSPLPAAQRTPAPWGPVLGRRGILPAACLRGGRRARAGASRRSPSRRRGSAPQSRRLRAPPALL